MIDCSFKVARQQWFEIGAEKGGIRCRHFINAREVETANQFTFYDEQMKEHVVTVPEAHQHVEMMRTMGQLVTGALPKEERHYWRDLALHTQIVVDALYRSAVSGQPVVL